MQFGFQIGQAEIQRIIGNEAAVDQPEHLGRLPRERHDPFNRQDRRSLVLEGNIQAVQHPGRRLDRPGATRALIGQFLAASGKITQFLNQTFIALNLLVDPGEVVGQNFHQAGKTFLRLARPAEKLTACILLHQVERADARPGMAGQGLLCRDLCHRRFHGKQLLLGRPPRGLIHFQRLEVRRSRQELHQALVFVLEAARLEEHTGNAHVEIFDRRPDRFPIGLQALAHPRQFG